MLVLFKPLPTITALEFVLWLCKRRRRVKVIGHSMVPVIKPGQEILYNPYAYRNAIPKIGEIVVSQHPVQADVTIVKRIGTGSSHSALSLIGDNPEESSDSRIFGLVPLEFIQGQVTCLF